MKHQVAFVRPVLSHSHGASAGVNDRCIICRYIAIFGNGTGQDDGSRSDQYQDDRPKRVGTDREEEQPT